MKGRRAAFVLGAFLGALATQDLVAGDNDRAVPRGGGGGGSHSGGGGSHGGGGGAAARHPSSGGGGSSAAGGSSYNGGSSYSGSSYSASRPPQTGAQRRQPVPGQGHYGHGHGGGYGRGHGYYGHGYGYYGGYYPYYYWPYWGWGYGYYSPWYYPYSGFYAGFGYPYYGGGYVGLSYSGGGGYGGGGYESSGSVRLLVEPVQTKVYVDGYYAGKVDDFDGMFQRLNLRPGAHDITLKLDGYETHRIKLYLSGEHTIKVRHDMARGDSSQVSEQTVGDPADAERYARREREEREYDPRESEDREPTEPPMRIEEGGRGDDSWSQGRERGTLRLDVTPADASIYVDGMFRGTGQDLRRLNLPPGRHRLEVVRPGYRTLERDVEVRAGETEQVQVDLPRS
jgi:hypothetical protein